MDSGSKVSFPDTRVGLSIFSVHSGKLVDALEETERYEYELDMAGYSIVERSGILWHNRITHVKEQGRIEPGNFVGLLPLELRDSNTDKIVSEMCLEVRSKKLDYESEYRAMLEDIADRCADFLLQLESPVEQYLTPDDEVNEATLAQRLYFLKSLLGGEDFQMALQRIIAMPNTRWREEVRSIDIRQARRLGRTAIRQLASSGRRMELSQNHPLRQQGLMQTIPERIEINDKRDTVDTPENRFVKHALTLFLQTLEHLLAKLQKSGCSGYPGLQNEINGLIDGLEETLAHDVFKTVSLPDMLPLNSPVLQRKEGYRQVLRAWMMFELAARLSWEGGDDVYSAGKRDAAALYEYWVFFKMLDLVADLFDLNNPPVEDLINDQDLVLKLKAGVHLPIEGVYSGSGRKLRVEFSYNRTFGGAREYPAQGSWSRQMRPDYTLSLWPAEFDQPEAEKQELITHVHFDAKYKVDNLVKLFGKANDNLDEEQSYNKDPQQAGTYKRADLLKMHAYRDAIRRSAGAYVLYPGTRDKKFHGFHELLPGLGAFPLRPNESDDGSALLARFLKEVVAHVCNRASQWEQQTYHTYRIHKDEPPDAVRESMPEWGDVHRNTPVQETYVLHGWLKGPEYRAWVQSSKLYNFRTEKRGSLRLHESVAGASYILLHGEGEYQGGGRLYRITSEGPRVFSKETLAEKGYPGEGSQPYYLVYDVEPLAVDDPLADYDWDLRLVDGIDYKRGSAIPKKGIPLNEFMKGAVPRK